MKPVKAIFVGRPSAGKGPGYAWFPKPHIVFDTDGKIENLKYLYRDKIRLRKLDSINDFDRENLTHIQYREYPGYQSYDQYYLDCREMLDNPPMAPDGSPGTWTHDSLTTLSDNTIQYMLHQRGGGGKSIGRILIPDLPEWLGESMFLSSLFTDAKDLPCHVILVGHWTVVDRDTMVTGAEKRAGAPGGSRIKTTKQMITGGTKIGIKLPSYFNEIYNFQAIPSQDGGEQMSTYLVYTGPTEEAEIGRSRMHPELPYRIDLTYDHTQGGEPPKLWDYIEKAMKQIGDEERKESDA